MGHGDGRLKVSRISAWDLGFRARVFRVFRVWFKGLGFRVRVLWVWFRLWGLCSCRFVWAKFFGFTVVHGNTTLLNSVNAGTRVKPVHSRSLPRAPCPFRRHLRCFVRPLDGSMQQDTKKTCPTVYAMTSWHT